MRKIFLYSIFIALFSISYLAIADFTVNLYVDSAPNRYGSPNWTPWWDQTKTDVVAGNFTNMRTGTYPGTNWFDPYDEIVYSTGDLGKRIHWIYWIPGKSKEQLNNLFQAKMVIDWNGIAYTYDWNQGGILVVDNPNIGWVQPGSWENYNNGVIGSFGHAWWATDNEALPYSNDGNPYNETDQADIDALRAEIFKYQTYAIGKVRYRQDVNSGWEYKEIKLNVIPEPGTIILMGSGLIGVAGYAKIRLGRKSKKVS